MPNLKVTISGAGSVKLLINGIPKEVLRGQSSNVEVPLPSMVTLIGVPDAGQQVEAWYNVYTGTWFPTGLTTVAIPITTNNYSYLIYFMTNKRFQELPPSPTLPTPTPPDSPHLPDSQFIGEVCSLNPSIIFNKVWWNVSAPYKGIIASNMTYSQALSKLQNTAICNMTFDKYIDSLGGEKEIKVPPTPPPDDGEGEDDDDETDNSRLLMIAGIGVLVLTAIYLSRRKK